MSAPRDRQRKQKRQRAQVIAKALRNRDETREKLLAQGRALARRRAENVQRSRDRTEEATTSTNPSRHSTLPPMDSNEEAAARHAHSTVPARPEGSTVPAADRLYGLRLYARIRDGDESGTTQGSGDESRTPASADPDSGGDNGDDRQ